MSNTPSNTPSNTEAWDLWLESITGGHHPASLAKFARAVLAKWGTPQPVVREPLTDEQIELLMRSIGTTYADDNDERMKNHAGWQRMNHRQIVRAIEAHHGIKGGQHDGS